MMLNLLRTAVVLCDEQLRIREANTAAEQLLGLSLRQVRGRRLSEIIVLPRALLNALEGADPWKRDLVQRETEIVDITGEAHWVDITATRQDIDGVPCCVFEFSALDRHRRIAREEELTSQRELTHELLRSVAHEVKNPLGGLRGAAQLLNAEFDEADPLREYTRVIIAEADRLVSLVDRMLGPGVKPNLQNINIHELTEHLRNLLMPQARRNIQIERDYDPSIPEIIADRDWLLQALINLGQNALSILHETGQGQYIWLRTRVLSHFTLGNQRHRLVAVIQVCDDGPGVEPSLRDRLFFPLVTGRAGGTGLGLSIAQTLVSRHGGLIECNSCPGDTVFSVYLPMEPARHGANLGD